MIHYSNSKKFVTVFLMAIKLVLSVIIICCPEMVEMCYPFALFTPLFFLAVAYGGISKLTAIGMVVLMIAMGTILIVFPVLLLVKKHKIKWITIVLQVLFIIEALSLFVSFFMGGFFRKLLGVVLNILIAAMLSEIREAEKYGAST